MQDWHTRGILENPVSYPIPCSSRQRITRVAEENVFLPPTRIIGFNPQLKMNDGLLVQSYMAVYDTDFSDATRIVEKEVAHIFTALHEEGKVDLPNIGELRYSIHGIYDTDIPEINKDNDNDIVNMSQSSIAGLSPNDIESTYLCIGSWFVGE